MLRPGSLRSGKFDVQLSRKRRTNMTCDNKGYTLRGLPRIDQNLLIKKVDSPNCSINLISVHPLQINLVLAVSSAICICTM
jgi:hypothetical protein